MSKNTFTRREFLSLLAVATASLGAGSLLGCSSAHPLGRAKELERMVEEGESGARLFTDSVDRQIALPASVTEVVPSGAYAQVLFFTLCPEVLKGLASSVSKTQERYFPDYVTELPVLGRYYGKNAEMNYEEVIRLAPDAIIDVGETTNTVGEEMDDLQRQTGLPCVHVNAELQNVPTAYRMLGEALGVPERAEMLAQYVEDVMAYVAERRPQIEARDIRLLHSSGAYGYSVTARGSIHARILELLGVDNVADTIDTNSAEVSPEQVMNWQPEVLILSPDMGFYDSIYDDGTWAEIKAVKDRRVYESPYEPYEWTGKPPSVQTVLGIQWLGNLVAPDLYDFDMVDVARDFYNTFWRCDLTEEEARWMLRNSTLKDV